jgi:hypothetical protein
MTEIVDDLFPYFAAIIKSRFEELSAGELYTTDIEDAAVIYLGAFPEGTNPIFRERTEHDCTCCKHFVRRLGSLVAIIDGQRTSVWDAQGLPYPYTAVAAKMNEAVCGATITGVFRTKETKFGTEYNYEAKTGKRWNHLYGTVAARHLSADFGTEIGRINGVAQVLRRGLEELTLSAVSDVLDLIEENTLYRGAEFKKAVTDFQKLHLGYHNAWNKDLFVWENVHSKAARVRNTAIGTLLVDLSKGVELDKAVRSFESVVAPANYKRPTSLITPKMIESAVSKLQELGLESAVERRYATIEDVSVNNVLFVDNSVKGKMKDGLTAALLEEVKPQKIDVKKTEEITMDEFLSTIVPQASSIELLAEGRHLGNFVSLTAPVGESVGRLFKWDNDFAWSYDGDLADSIKQRVKSAGGDVDALLRVSLGWHNYDDLDLHAITPTGTHICFASKFGVLDVDMHVGRGTCRNPVENMAFKNITNGTYRIIVDNFCKRESVDVGFELEVEFGGQIHQFTHENALGDKRSVESHLVVKGGQLVEIIPGPGLVGGSISREKWGVHTETLVPVETIMLSPNFWDGQSAGNKHWIFVLKDCKNPGSTRGIYNEFLRSDLEVHRKVFEVLGAKTKCAPSDKQLSGVGFSSTSKDSVTVVVKGRSINRAFTIKF